MTTSYRPTGLLRYHAAGVYPGYTLFSPNGGDDAYLIDMEGNFVHRWRYPGGIAYGYLLDNGNLLFRDQGSNPPGADHIRELDWDSRLVWEYYNPSLRRHNRLPNGNNLFLLQRDKISTELTRRVRGGFTTDSDPERMFSDQVVEVTSDGTEVNVWRSPDHLEPETDVICPLESRNAWGGANDLTSSPDGSTFLISFRILDTVALVDRSTGRLLGSGGRVTYLINTIPPIWTTGTCCCWTTVPTVGDSAIPGLSRWTRLPARLCGSIVACRWSPSSPISPAGRNACPTATL